MRRLLAVGLLVLGNTACQAGSSAPTGESEPHGDGSPGDSTPAKPSDGRERDEPDASDGAANGGGVSEALPVGDVENPVKDESKIKVVIVDGETLLSAEPGAVTPGAEVFVELDAGEQPLELVAAEDGSFSVPIPPGRTVSIPVIVRTDEGEGRVLVSSGARVYCSRDDELLGRGELTWIDNQQCVCTEKGWACAEAPSNVPDACSVYTTDAECLAKDGCFVLEGRLLEDDVFSPRTMLRCSSLPTSNCKLAAPSCVRHFETDELALLPDGCAAGAWEPVTLDWCLPSAGRISFAAEPTCSENGLEYFLGTSFPRGSCNTCTCALDDVGEEAVEQCTAKGCGGTESLCFVGNAALPVGASFIEPASCNACACGSNAEGDTTVECDAAHCPRVAAVPCPPEMLELQSWPFEVTAADAELVVLQAAVPTGEDAVNFRLCHALSSEEAPDGSRTLRVSLVHLGASSGELEEGTLEVNLWPLTEWLGRRGETELVRLVGLGTELSVAPER